MNRSIVFLCSVFPCLSETFIYDQLHALDAMGLPFEIVSNRRPQEEEVHPRMRDILARVHYLNEVCPCEILAVHIRMLTRHPVRYFSALAHAFFVEEKLLTSLFHITGALIALRRFAHLRNLHFHAHFTYGAASVAMWAARLAGVTYSLTLHGADLIFDNPPDLEKKLSGAAALVSISRFNVDFVKEHFPSVDPGKLVVIPMGIPPIESLPSRPIREKTLRLLTVGRLSDHKAQHDLVDACAILQTRGMDFQCHIVGEGDKREFLETRIRERNLESRVHLLGPRFHDEVLALYHEYDLFVLCSITEGQPVVLMEAMRAGIPFVATAISAVPELVQDSGVLVPPSDPEALAGAIQRFANGEIDCDAMTSKAKSIIAQNYNLETNHRRFKEFLEAS